MVYACGERGVDGGAVMGFASLPLGSVVEVHGYPRGGNEEEARTVCERSAERRWVVEVGIADGDTEGGWTGESRVVGGRGGADDEVFWVDEVVVENGIEDGRAKFACCAGEGEHSKVFSTAGMDWIMNFL